jgi:PAS domain S-box-containing protein
MSLLTIAWSGVAAACLTIGFVQAGIWLRERRTVRLWFVLAAVAAAANAVAELAMLHAESVAAFTVAMKGGLVATGTIVIGLVWFIVFYFGTARAWLAHFITVAWVVQIVTGLALPYGAVYAHISEIRSLPLPWGEHFSVAVGTQHAWRAVLELPTVAMLFLFAEASVTLWRQGGHRRALLVGGGTVCFLVVGGVHTSLVDAGIVATPYLISFAFLAVILGMALELSDDVVRASLLTREVAANERRWRTLLEDVQLLVIGVDGQGRIEYVNPFFSRVTGFSADEVLRQPLWTILPAADRVKAEATWHAVMSGQRHPHAESALVTKAGGDLTVSWSNVHLHDSEGRPAGMLGIGADITERRQAETVRDRALLEAAAALREVEELKSRLEEEVVYLSNEITSAGRFDEIVGESDALRYVLHKVEQVAPFDTTVVIEGETGVGKELFARAIHARSPRGERPMVKVNCAALPASLVEAELFGHERGAFTGAVATRKGRFELADGRTLFLDEVTELPLELQPKLLRVLQEGEFERVGGTHTITVDVRVIVASNRRLIDAVASGRFREDLYYRLHVYPITVPPLRQRREDIALLAAAFVEHFAKAQGKRIDRIPQQVMDALAAYDWPGNVRELQNVIEQAVVTTPNGTLRLATRLERPEDPVAAPPDSGPADDLRVVERDHIVRVLENSGWRIEGKGRAAERLGLHPNTLRFRMRKLGIERPTRTVGTAPEQQRPGRTG